MDTAEPLEAVFTTVLKGADELEAGAKAADRFAAAEQKAAQQLQRTAQAFDQTTQAAKRMRDARGRFLSEGKTLGVMPVLGGSPNNGVPYPPGLPFPPPRPNPLPTINGPYQARQRALDKLKAAKDAGISGDALKDFQYGADQASNRVKAIERRNTPGMDFAQSVLSSRFGGGGKLGGLMPLVGQSIKAVAGEKGLEAATGMLSRVGAAGAGAAGAFFLAAKAAYETGKFLMAVSKESAELTQQFSDMRRASGGSSIDAARSSGLSRYTGVDAGSAARSFNDRITSDPFAMGLAAQMGISNTPGMYGRRNFGQQYQQAIARTAAIRDRDARERTAEALGIGQEVDRYRLLGSGTRKRMDETARITARVNNPEAERKAAELQAAVANEAQARENLKNAFGQGFGGGATKFLNWLADQENGVADWMTNTNSFFDKFRIGSDKNYGKRSADALAQVDRESAASGGMSAGMTAQAANTQAMNNLTAAFLKYADKVYGGGERARNATPPGLTGANLHRALQSKGLALGYLA